MEEDFVKEYKIKNYTAKEKDEDIIRNVIKAKSELECSINNFEYAERDLIDYFSYQIKANQAKLDYLLKKAKKRGILLSMIEEIELKSKKAM